MGKRRVIAVDSDEEDSQPSPAASKRARTEDSDEDVEVQAPKRDTKGKGKAVQNDDDDVVEDVDVDEDEDVPQLQDSRPEDDEKFEEENEDAVRAAIEAKRKVQGGIAEHGIIEAIEMHQFMCHKFLTFTFGPQINFITGHNGSGKSAVLTAITVALGGKANSTGRGTGLKSFIREGQSVAEVTITIKNQGEEAYRPKDYGQSIVISRRFTKEGTSSWKVKSKAGKVISTKKEELSAICDHMNIQVDNPMNVLTQDAARQFLSASGPADKYKFFLRGTQLTQLCEEYDTLLENITQTSKVLQQKKQAIPDLRAIFKEASMRFEEASKAREQRKKADELKKELAWAHVAGKEDEMRRKFDELGKMKRRVPKIQESIDSTDVDLRKAIDEVTISQAERDDLGNIENLHSEKKKLSEQMRTNKTKIVDFMREEKQMNESVQSINRQIAEYDERIDVETRRMETQTQARRDETLCKLQQAKADVDEAQKQLNDIVEKAGAQKTENDRIKNEGDKVDTTRANAEKRIMEINEMIKQCRQQRENAFAPYGRNVKELVNQIGRTKWYGEKPLGPLGLYVKVKQPELWADLLRSQLSSFMTAFAITDARDRSQLKRLLDQSRNSNLLIIISERDLFDYRAGEPPADKLTILRALEISDEFVLRILINQANIERNILARTRLAGEQALGSLRGGTAFTADWFRVNKFSDGGGSSVRLQRLAQNDPKNLLFTGRDGASSIQHYEDQLRTAEGELQAARQKFDELKQSYSNGRRALDTLNAEGKRANERFQLAKKNQNTLQDEANEELPAGIVGLAAAKAEAIKEKESVMEQFAEVERQKGKVDAVQKELLTQVGIYKAQIDEFEERRSAMAKRVEDAAAARAEAQNKKMHYEKKLADENGKIVNVEKTAELLEEEFKNWTAKALEYCERFENPRKVIEVQRNLESVQKALKEREKTHGATVEEMTVEVNKAKANLEAVEKDFKSMAALNKTLKMSHTIRVAKWQEFRRHIALRCKLVFTYQLSHRGYYGKVLFDHNLATLQLKVQTDDQAGTQARDKDPRALSGGEKSFSTICLLLSLWESIGCPLRCLDEFDVFMDAVNRRISMRMMVETANKSDKKQYILITPQDMNSVQIGKTVRVHRMPDPERGQAMLNF